MPRWSSLIWSGHPDNADEPPEGSPCDDGQTSVRRVTSPRPVRKMPGEPPPRASRLVIMRDLAALPKAHLHVHLESTIRPGTLRELGEANGVDVPAEPPV